MLFKPNVVFRELAFFIKFSNHKSQITNHESGIRNKESRIMNHESRIGSHAVNLYPTARIE